MTEPNTVQSPATSAAEKRPYEPSMEEILASIRRIIADDNSLPGRTPEPAVTTTAAEKAVTILLKDEPSPAPAPVSILRPASKTTPEPVSVPQASQIGALASPSPGETILEPTSVPPAESTIEPAYAPAAELSGDFIPEPPSMQGLISAPQFASPAGPQPAELPVNLAPEPVPEEHAQEGLVGDAGSGSLARSDAGPDLEPMGDAEPLSGEPRAADGIDHNARLRDLEQEIHELEEEIGRRQSLTAESEALFSAATDHSVTVAFNALAATRLADNSDELLGIAREMIRPLLKAWIDDNMPSMVERMIRAEIERVARGGR